MNRTLALAVLILLAVASGCRRASAPPAASGAAPPAAAAVENAALGLRFTALPEGVRVATNEGDRLVFDALSDGVPGNLDVTVAAAPDSGGINLLAEAKAFGEAAQAAGGRFFGGNELVTPYGAAYTVRTLVAGGTVEERRVYLLHPAGGERLVTLALRYPPGDSVAASARMKQVLGLLEALEPLAAPSPAPAPAPAG
jgi:hypothetical protein